MIFEDLATLVDDFNVGPLTLERPSLAQDSSGGWTESVTTTSVDPVAVHAIRRGFATPYLERAPEGSRLDAWVRIYARSEIRLNDRLFYLGKAWRVIDVDDRSVESGTWGATAERVDAQDPRA